MISTRRMPHPKIREKEDKRLLKSKTFKSTNFLRHPGIRQCLLPLAACSLAGLLADSANAQSRIQPSGIFFAKSTVVAETLPDAPEAVSSSSVMPTAPIAIVADGHSSATLKMAGPYDKYIEPGQSVPQINAHDKFVLGVKDAFSPFSFVGWLIGAGYEQAADSSPNYGHNSVAFGKRLGAGALRNVSEGIFGDSILAPILHEDPRYYKMGPGHNFVKRIAYSGTRAIIIRKDNGGNTFNFAQLGGNLGGAMLTNVYYPDLNRGFTQTAETFGTSVGGSALGFVVSEFLSGFLQAVHLQHHD